MPATPNPRLPPCPQRAVPADAEQLLLGIIEDFKAARAADRAENEEDERAPRKHRLLVVYNAVINSLAELG